MRRHGRRTHRAPGEGERALAPDLALAHWSEPVTLGYRPWRQTRYPLQEPIPEFCESDFETSRPRLPEAHSALNRPPRTKVGHCQEPCDGRCRCPSRCPVGVSVGASVGFSVDASGGLLIGDLGGSVSRGTEPALQMQRGRPSERPAPPKITNDAGSDHPIIPGARIHQRHDPLQVVHRRELDGDLPL